VKLEITETGLLVIETPMGFFQIHETNCGISLVFVAPGAWKAGHEVFYASRGPQGEHVFHGVYNLALTEPALPTLPPRVAAHIDGPRMGKAAKPISGTISREEFIRAYTQYKLCSGQQDVEQLLNGGGFSYAELDALLLGQSPQSWIEDKLEALPQRDKLAEDQEDKLEDRANPVITPRDKLEDPTTIESTGVVEKGAER
jgi:hypothetical protein